MYHENYCSATSNRTVLTMLSCFNVLDINKENCICIYIYEHKRSLFNGFSLNPVTQHDKIHNAQCNKILRYRQNYKNIYLIYNHVQQCTEQSNLLAKIRMHHRNFNPQWHTGTPCLIYTKRVDRILIRGYVCIAFSVFMFLMMVSSK